MKRVSYNLSSQTKIGAETDTQDFITRINKINPGSRSYNRIGRKVVNKYLDINLVFTHVYGLQDGLNSVFDGNVVRVAVVWDRFPKNETPTYVEIFKQYRYNGTAFVRFNSSLNPDQQGRFELLYDKFIDFVPKASSPPETANQFVHVDTKKSKSIKLSLGNKITIYDKSNNDDYENNIKSGAIYVIFKALFCSTEAYNQLFMTNGNATLYYEDN